MFGHRHVLLTGWGLAGAAILAAADSDRLLAPAEAARAATVPEGFRLDLFAAEPEVTQPVAMAFDDRGRLWVVECHTYADLKTNYDTNRHDRIVILEDTDGDGRMDRRQVFWDRGQRVTSVEIGFGGVWVLCAPQMVFIPDRNGDDVPDGPPEPLLDGWDAGPVRHNIVNGLKWGPDGWLYGRHGIQATSHVGAPGASAFERVPLNCAIWRFHPVHRRLEVVCQGGTNPWGHDWDDYGELFFINTVIGHLWHGIPGAWFKRMYGEHLAPRRYALIDQHADHYHWDTGKNWTDSRDAGAGADALGGGHAHSGLMIYLGGVWPDAYHNALFTLNFHGRRINQEKLVFQGSGYVARHQPDLVKFADPWFRGIELAYGPDGQVLILDWSDTGECHENDADGVHRETGRIYRLSHSAAPPRQGVAATWNETTLRQGNLAAASDAELAALQAHPNEWFVRHARRLLQERAAAGRDLTDVRRTLREQLAAAGTVPAKLRLLWALHAGGGATPEFLAGLLRDPAPQIRVWAIRLLLEPGREVNAPVQALPARLAALAATENSPMVRLALASALQKLPLEEREPLAAALLARAEDNQDHNIPLMLWYGVEPLAAADPKAALRLAQASQLTKPRQFLARKLAEDLNRSPGPINDLLVFAVKADPVFQADLLRGMSEALRGWRKAPQPAAWEHLAKTVGDQGPEELRRLVRELGVVFGDGRALAELRALALNRQAEAETRAAALRQLVEARPPDLQPILEKLINDSATAGVAIRGLGFFNDPDIPEMVLKVFPKLSAEDQAAAISLLVSRPGFAAELLEAVAQGRVPRPLVNASQARQIQGYGRENLTRRLREVWGEIRATDTAKQEAMNRYRRLFAPERLKAANLAQGREVFSQACGVCHKLYGEGGSIGPDLTGSGRSHLDYLLENILDPSAMVPADYRAAFVHLKDERELSAVILDRTDRTITLQTATEKLTVEQSEIRQIAPSNVSLMPEGLLEGLTESQALNLIAYLMHTNQVRRP